MEGHPRRGDAVEAWLRHWRDKYDDEDKRLHDFASPYWTIDQMINEYQNRADAGTPLDQPSNPK